MPMCFMTIFSISVLPLSIIFLRDPLTAQPHEPDVSALLRLCDVQKIPLATNVSSAIIMLESLKNGTFPGK